VVVLDELSCGKLSSFWFTALQAALHMFLVGPLLLLFLLKICIAAWYFGIVNF
jgi:hypothetical protein